MKAQPLGVGTVSCTTATHPQADRTVGKHPPTPPHPRAGAWVCAYPKDTSQEGTTTRSIGKLGSGGVHVLVKQQPLSIRRAVSRAATPPQKKLHSTVGQYQVSTGTLAGAGVASTCAQANHHQQQCTPCTSRHCPIHVTPQNTPHLCHCSHATKTCKYESCRGGCMLVM